MMNPGREMYVREIARSTEENINAIRRELANLEEMGLLKSKRRKSKDPFVFNVLKEPMIMLLGDLNDLG